MGIRFRRARKTMRNAFEKDSGLYEGYSSNIAMLLHDKHGIVNHEQRNKAAEAILTLIFW